MTVNPSYGVDHLDANKSVDDEGSTTVDLYIASHGKTKRTGGPYMDDIQREKAEELRAKMEDREPDLDNPPADVATKLVAKSQLVETDVDKTHIFATVEVENEPVDSYVVPAEKNEPDPSQVDWDNDGTKVAALEAAAKYKKLVEDNKVTDTPEPTPAFTSEGDNV